MFSRLPESNASRQRRTAGFVVSTVVHAVLIAAAVRATGLRAAPAPEMKPVPPIYLDRTPPKPAPPTPRRYQGGPSMPSVPRPPAVAIDFDKIPDTIPVSNSMSGLIDSAFDATRLATSQPTGTPNVVGDSPLTKDMVEHAVVAIPGTATPRYPSMLQSAGLEGDVRAQFVVDTLGRVEQGTFHVLQSTHDLFATAVRDALGRARFKPAEVGGHKVRQLVEQTFTFRITR